MRKCYGFSNAFQELDFGDVQQKARDNMTGFRHAKDDLRFQKDGYLSFIEFYPAGYMILE